MINKIILGNEKLNIALAEFADKYSEEGYFKVLAALAESYDMKDQFFVAFNGDTFQSIRDEEEDYLVMFTGLEAAEEGPDTDLAVMDLEDLIGNILIDDEMAGFVIDPFTESIFIDREGCNVIRSAALSGPVAEVLMDLSLMDHEERLSLAESVEKGEDNFVPNKVLAAVIYNEIAEEEDEELYEEMDPEGIREIENVRARAKVRLSGLIMEGFFFEADEERAKDLLMDAADQLDTEAMVKLGLMEEKEGNLSQATDFYLKAAMMGDAKGLVEYGRMLLEGKGIPKDIDLAYECFLKASEESEESAYYYLGLYAEKGYLQGPDMDLAEYYYDLGMGLDDKKCTEKMHELFGFETEEDDDVDDEDDDDDDDRFDPFIFDFSKGPGGMRS